MNCKYCETPTFNCKCIKCTARLILTLPLKLRAYSIENSRFDVDDLKAEVIRQHEGTKK